MLANELRRKYIDYFAGKGHLHLPGAPLVPIDALGVEDRSTLFTSAGMQQFKPYFVGAAAPPSGRVVTVQKCVRTGDIDSVGDYSHCTFFEMLGNFSFGDYFKAEVIPWTWDFLISELGLDPDRFCVTVYDEDDEAYEIWNKVVGLPPDRIHRLSGEKNFWPPNAISDGPNGPCGPCTEVFYRVAPIEEMTTDPALTPAQRYKIDDDAGRYVELWNNVFTQFDRQEGPAGEPIVTPLPAKNNDTGAGFDRIVMVLQNKRSVFETDLFQPVLDRISRLSGLTYHGTMSPADLAFRVVAEHVRSAVFCIADGILPSNEGRGYVLRRILRRAIRYGKTALGFDEPFLHEVAPAVIEQMGGFYTELVDRREHILKTILGEEERFRRTLSNGMDRLSEMLDSLASGRIRVLSGRDAFTLYDTFGFPIELTQEITAEHGVELDVPAFEVEMQKARVRSRTAGGLDTELFKDFGSVLSELQQSVAATEFVGYDGPQETTAKILAIVRGDELVDFARPGDEVDVVLDRSPFYAESGGQVGDTGEIASQSDAAGMRAIVLDTRKAGGSFLHRVRIEGAELNTGQGVLAKPDLDRRMHIRRNHTATHLLQAALRDVVGTHVHQKGSLVAPDRLRFDFTHTKPLTTTELQSVEEEVNRAILADRDVRVSVDVPIAEARERGAMALFGEKYGERVRVVEVTGISVELCGGTHLNHTSQAGLFKILSETGVAAGVRRIEAITGEGLYDLLKQRDETLEQLASVLKTGVRDVLSSAEKLVAQCTDLQKQVRQLKIGKAGATGELTRHDVQGIPFATGELSDADAEVLAARADAEMSRLGDGVVVIAGVTEGKVLFVAKVAPALVKRGLHAGNLVRDVAKIAGGGGGGRPDFAQAGGRDASKVAAALESVSILVGNQIGASSTW